MIANRKKAGLLVVLGGLLVGIRLVQAADSAEDMRMWQGTWKLVSCTYDGAPRMNDVRWVVDGDRYTIFLRESHETWTFKLDAGKQQIEANRLSSPSGYSGAKLRGIYAVNGNSLRVCYSLTGVSYPKSFDAKQGSRQVLYEFQRERR